MAINFPDAPNVGDQYTEAGAAAVWEWDGEMWIVVGSAGADPGTALNEQHSWAVSGDVADDTYPGTFALKDAGETLSTTRFRAHLESGACNVQFRLNGGLIGAATGVSGTAATTTLVQALADGDRLELDVSGGASPVNLMVTLEMTRSA